MTTAQILIGFGLIILLAVGSQVLASRLRIPALIVLLPAGFAAGALTGDVNPQHLLGASFVRPAERLQRVLIWEGSLIDPVGGVLGALSNMRGFDIPARRPFFETLVQLIIGALFISISATVTLQYPRHLILSTAKILPATFLVIVATVTLYGLTAAPVVPVPAAQATS